MKILIITPLFPPDTGAPAHYVKTLLPELQAHDVTVILYGYLPESTKDVSVIALDKRWPKIYLLGKSFLSLIRHGRHADLLLVNNGPSTELPSWAASFFIHTPTTLCVSDPIADKASGHGLYKFIHRLFCKRVTRVIRLPESFQTYLKAEKLPFSTFDEQAEKERLAWWKTHVSTLTAL